MGALNPLEHHKGNRNFLSQNSFKKVFVQFIYSVRTYERKGGFTDNLIYIKDCAQCWGWRYIRLTFPLVELCCDAGHSRWEVELRTPANMC